MKTEIENYILDWGYDIHFKHVDTLVNNKALYIGEGMTSICFGNEEKIYGISNRVDYYKQFLSENKTVNKHLPYVEYLDRDEDSTLYMMKKVDVVNYHQMSSEQATIFNELSKLRYINLDTCYETVDIPDSLKEALVIIINYISDEYGIHEVSFDLKIENVGWIDNDIILFDLLCI